MNSRHRKSGVMGATTAAISVEKIPEPGHKASAQIPKGAQIQVPLLPGTDVSSQVGAALSLVQTF